MMVKEIDEFSPDHVGWRLWQAAFLWRDRFAARMVAEGFGWYAEARSSVLPYVHPKDGTKQTEIVARMGLTKQAVQQLIVDLETAGVVRRDPDPADGRARIVRLTETGRDAHRAAARIKTELEAEIRAELGPDAFEALRAALVRLTDPA